MGNKANLIDQRKVTKEDAEEWADKHGMKYFEVNSLDVNSVNELIYQAVETVCDNLDSGYYGKLGPSSWESHGIITRGDLKLINQGGSRKNPGAGLKS